MATTSGAIADATFHPIGPLQMAAQDEANSLKLALMKAERDWEAAKQTGDDKQFIAAQKKLNAASKKLTAAKKKVQAAIKKDKAAALKKAKNKAAAKANLKKAAEAKRKQDEVCTVYLPALIWSDPEWTTATPTTHQTTFSSKRNSKRQWRSTRARRATTMT